MNALIELWKTNPAVRALARVAVVAVAGYATAAIKEGVTDWKSFAGGAVTAAIYAVVGAVTPVEPKVGVKTAVVDKPPV